MKKILLPVLLFPILLFGQNEEKSNWLKKLEKYKIQPVAALQVWSTYTIDQKVFNTPANEYEPVEDRFNTQLRRSRLGVKGQPYENLKFNLTAALDFVGRDILTGTQAGGNNGGSPAFRAWNAYVQWRVNPRNESFNITAGYLVPQIGRESITAASSVISMEKSWSQNYLRRHIVGTGPGRAVGINFGGLLPVRADKFMLRYDAGIFNPIFSSTVANSSGEKSSELYVGRLVFQFGEPESEKYSIGHQINYFGKRNGVSLGVAGTWQGENDLFKKNYAVGFDLLANYNGLILDGEWTNLWREQFVDFGVGSGDRTVDFWTGYARLSYNLKTSQGYYFTPYFMYSAMEGATDTGGQIDASILQTFSGIDRNLSFGVNFYLNPKLKFTLNYTSRSGESGLWGHGKNVNNLYWQNGVGAIERGDWLGIGLMAGF